MPDGQPKQLLVVLPGYPLVNFALVTAGYIFVSHRLFELTNAFKTLAVPHSNNQLLLRNTLLLMGTGALVYMAAACVMQLHAKFS
ncbi:Cas1_acylT domain-containing protein [Haematococcus lacustris]|uniref:Cas1_acylT domain-containing protein n=1 Tax=Haematococcus lacustris TaxID=44745 RepID=A0A699ZRW5_HAELA|nr:Cas1_acylT domain-containing protein [Haematococcus lacustris]